MNSFLSKILGLVIVVAISAISFIGCDNDVVNTFITPTTISTVSEYGVYFGSKAGGLAKNDALIIETSFEAIIKILDADSIDNFVDISKKIENLPDVAKKYIGEALEVVNKNFVKVKGKIPAEKVPYVKAVFTGGLKGMQKYIASIDEVTVKSGYETELANDYSLAKKRINY